MKHFFIARHGAYYLGGRLNKLGQQQIAALGRAIKEILNGDSVYIISSTAPRALDSSEQLAQHLKTAARIEAIPCLWYAADSDHYDPVGDLDRDEIYKIVNERREKADALILMAHEELRDEFSGFFSEQEFGKRFHCSDIDKGQADHYSMAEESYQLIPKTES
ncbi:MAG: histidine phosphatase family protein [Deltaproteobacteria bacterium]|nr:histidine phosphatase family protein [Deltaproteobacteria bacterium]